MKKANIILSLLFSTILAAVMASGCALSIEAEVPEVEVTQKDITFEGVPGAGQLGEIAMTRSFSQKHQKLELPAGLDPEVHAIDVTITAKKGISDFKFLTVLRLTMGDEKNPTSMVELINYQQDRTNPPGKTVTMVSANPVNTLEQWKSDAALFTMDIAGILPETDWAIDVTMRFAGSIKYKY